MTKDKARNGAAPMIYGSTLSPDALRILASLTPAELRAVARRLGTACTYGGKDEWAAICGVKVVLRAAEVA